MASSYVDAKYQCLLVRGGGGGPERDETNWGAIEMIPRKAELCRYHESTPIAHDLKS
jgi:hypothetical protein